MPADKDPIRSTHETLALIADKLAMDRGANDDLATSDPPFPAASVPPPAEQPQPEPPAAPEPKMNDVPAKSASGDSAPRPADASPGPAAAAGEPASPPPSQPAMPVALVPRAVTVRSQPVRDALVTYFPMTIAVLSLVLSIYQGYLFHESLNVSQQSIDVMQKNVARGEFSRACRDAIETYFQVKQKISVLMPAADRSNIVGASRVTEANRLDAQGAVAKFGGLGTYLANFQDAATRTRYTELTRTLSGIMEQARTTQLPEIDKLFLPADKLFAQMNDDCARLSRSMRM